jgi:hypothetical protein
MADDKKKSNLKLALTLASIAIVFFVSVFVKRTLLS